MTQQQRGSHSDDHNPYRLRLSRDMTLAAALRDYPTLVFPAVGRQAEARPLREPLIAIAAAHEDRTIGLALAELRPDGASAELLSLVVAPEHQGRGVGTALVAQVERALHSLGCNMIDWVYRANWAGVPAIERIMRKRDWLEPQVRMLLCQGACENFAHAIDMQPPVLPNRFILFPWVELPLETRQTMQAQQAVAPWYPAVLTPFQMEDRIEPRTSLGLRYDDQVTGWLITHRLKPDTIQYTSLYVQPAFQQHGLASALVIEASRRQLISGVPFFKYQVQIENTLMVELVQRNLKPFLTSYTTSNASRKWLRRPASPTSEEQTP